MDIEKRFERLEQQNRNLKKGIILAVVFIGGFFGLGQMSPTPTSDYTFELNKIANAINGVKNAINAQQYFP